MAFPSHGLQHAQHGQRIDERRGGLLRIESLGQDHAFRPPQRAILRIGAECAAERDRAADNIFGALASPDNDTGTFISDRERLIEPVRGACEPRRRD
jgi:hypothetical protein